MKLILLYRRNTCILKSFQSKQELMGRIKETAVFLTRKTAVSFIRDRRATSGTLNEECREGCSYEEVSENLIPDLVSISNMISSYQELVLI